MHTSYAHASMLKHPRFRTLKKAEEHALFHQARQGDARAVSRLVEANMKFVVSVAVRYHSYGLPLEDLIQEGAAGLHKAIHEFNPATGNKFISYAVWWVRQRMLQALAKHGRAVKLPPNLISQLKRLEKVRSALENTLERRPTIEEIAEAAGMKTIDVQDCLSIQQESLSLDSPAADEEGADTIIQLLQDPDARADDRYEAGANRHHVDTLLASLEPRDREVVTRYFGFDGREQTLEEIAQAMDLTRERVRQLKTRAMERLKWASNKLGIAEDSGKRLEPFQPPKIGKQGVRKPRKVAA